MSLPQKQTPLLYTPSCVHSVHKITSRNTCADNQAIQFAQNMLIFPFPKIWWYCLQRSILTFLEEVTHYSASLYAISSMWWTFHRKYAECRHFIVDFANYKCTSRWSGNTHTSCKNRYCFLMILQFFSTDLTPYDSEAFFFFFFFFFFFVTLTKRMYV